MPLVTDKKRVSLYLDDAIYEEMRRLAKLRRRSLSNLIETICEEEIRRERENSP